MARAAEFDYNKAIDKATRVFWKQGYPGTSRRDLLKAIGIGEGSFYNTLKSKKRSFSNASSTTKGQSSDAMLRRCFPRLPQRSASAHFLRPCSTTSTITGPRVFASWPEHAEAECSNRAADELKAKQTKRSKTESPPVIPQRRGGRVAEGGGLLIHPVLFVLTSTRLFSSI